MTLAFELIKVAVGRQEQLSRKPSDEEWEQLYDFAIKQTLVGIMYHGVEKVPKEQRPRREVLLSWYFLTEKIKRHNSKLLHRTRQVTTLFQKNGFRSILLKGQGLALLYPDPPLRMSGDIDVWVEGSRDSIINFLRTKGVKSRIVYHNMPMRILQDTNVEVHFTPSWMNNYFTNRVLQDFFHSQQEEIFKCENKLDGESGTILVPTDSFNRVFILQHIYRHLFGSGIGLRQILDYYYVLEKGCTEDEKKETVEMLGKLHMLKFTAAMMYVLELIFGLERNRMLVEPDEKEGQFFLDEILRAGNFGYYDDRIRIPENENKLHSFFRITKQNMRLLKHYPEETLWNPVFRAWHYIWRVCKGYPIK